MKKKGYAMGLKAKTKKIKVPRFEKELGFVTTPDRSALMSKIRGFNTRPEVSLRKALWRLGVRYRINYKGLQGNPDIVIKKSKLIIFVDGEFWHGHNWADKKKRLKTNKSFWIPKIERNMQRDNANNEKLATLGYTVLRFWSSEVLNDLERCVAEIISYLD